jgi:hypothetical protein
VQLRPLSKEETQDLPITGADETPSEHLLQKGCVQGVPSLLQRQPGRQEGQEEKMVLKTETKINRKYPVSQKEEGNFIEL